MDVKLLHTDEFWSSQKDSIFQILSLIGYLHQERELSGERFPWNSRQVIAAEVYMNAFTVVDNICFTVIILLMLSIAFWVLGWVTWNEEN